MKLSEISISSATIVLVGSSETRGSKPRLINRAGNINIIAEIYKIEG